MHNRLAWWPDVKDVYGDICLESHPRASATRDADLGSGGRRGGDAHWLVIDTLAPENRQRSPAERPERFRGGRGAQLGVRRGRHADHVRAAPAAMPRRSG
mgnify:CR=1 FL=1